MSTYPELYIDEDGIFHEYHYDKIISKTCAIYVADQRNKLSSIKRPLLVEFQNLEGYATETRDMSLEFILQKVNSLAYYVDLDTTEGQRSKEVIDSFFSIVNWPIPVEVFSNKTEALLWLKQYSNM